MAAVDPATALGTARNLAWLIGVIGRALRLRPKEPPIFGVPWRFYDSAPTEVNAVGIATFEQTWWGRSVRGRWIRTRERSTAKDTHRSYVGTGQLRDRKLALDWVAEDRPNTFGVLFIAVDEDCRQMKGFTVLAPQSTGVPEALPIWFRRS